MKTCLPLLTLTAALALGVGCKSLDRLYTRQPVKTEVPFLVLTTNAVTVTNFVTVGTNLVTVIETNAVPIWTTNTVTLWLTNLVDRPAVPAVVATAGGVLDTYAPGLGGLLAALLMGAYGVYRNARNKDVQAALVQSVETARQVLQQTDLGRRGDAEFRSWLQSHQKEAGVLADVAALVDRYADNPAAQLAARTILERIKT